MLFSFVKWVPSQRPIEVHRKEGLVENLKKKSSLKNFNSKNIIRFFRKKKQKTKLLVANLLCKKMHCFCLFWKDVAMLRGPQALKRAI